MKNKLISTIVVSFIIGLVIGIFFVIEGWAHKSFRMSTIKIMPMLIVLLMVGLLSAAVGVVAKLTYNAHRNIDNEGWYRLLILITLAVSTLTTFGVYSFIGGGSYVGYVCTLIVGVILAYALTVLGYRSAMWIKEGFEAH